MPAVERRCCGENSVSCASKACTPPAAGRAKTRIRFRSGFASMIAARASVSVTCYALTSFGTVVGLGHQRYRPYMILPEFAGMMPISTAPPRVGCSRRCSVGKADRPAKFRQAVLHLNRFCTAANRGGRIGPASISSDQDEDRDSFNPDYGRDEALAKADARRCSNEPDKCVGRLRNERACFAATGRRRQRIHGKQSPVSRRDSHVCVQCGESTYFVGSLAENEIACSVCRSGAPLQAKHKLYN